MEVGDYTGFSGAVMRGLSRISKQKLLQITLRSHTPVAVATISSFS